jgi:LmbE family N-acetylglucosaminyl deacetylase
MENWFVPHFDATLPESKRALVLAPHPDDEVFGCAGASLALIHQGSSVQSIVFTNGCGEMAGDNKLRYVEQRENESREAAKILGCSEPEFLRFEDRALGQVNDLKDLIKQKLMKYRPDLVFAPSLWEIHPDHRALSWGILNALVECFEESSLDITLFQYEVGSAMVPNFILDITPWMSRKDDAVKAFRSQLDLRNYEGCIRALNQYRTLTLRPQALRAEAFICLKSIEIAQWLSRLSNNGYPNLQFQSDLALVAADVEVKELRKDINLYRVELSQLSSMVHQLRMDSDSLRSDLNLKEQALVANKAALEDHKVALQINKAALEDHKAALEDHKAALEDHKAAIQIKCAELDQTQLDLAHYKNLYNTIEQSRSWKITRPLRVFVQSMKKVKQRIRFF